MRLAVAALALGAFGCAEPAIELSLKLPSASSIPASFDLKCVSAVDVVVHPSDADETDIGLIYQDRRPPCVDLARPPENFTDIRNAMRGEFEIPIPLEGMLGVQIRGRVGSCDDRPPFHEAIFYGGALYRDTDSLAVPLVANISCNTRRDYEARPVDLLELTATKACPAPINVGEVFAGNIRPTLLDPALFSVMFEGGTANQTPANGTAIVGSYANIGTGSCVAIAYALGEQIGVTCINAGAPTVCGEPDEIEVPILPGGYMNESTDGELVDDYGVPTFIAVWETAPAKAPLAGAAVTLADPMHGQVVYLEPTAARFMPHAGPTGASGVFAVYADRVMEITVSAPGHASRKMLVGGTPQLFGTAIVVLTRN